MDPRWRGALRRRSPCRGGRRKAPSAVRAATVLINEPNDRPNEIRELYVRLIEQAERSIFIENPYVYHPTIVEALVLAKKRRPELSVALVLPARAWNDNEFAHDAQQHAYPDYLASGIGVYEYRGHFTHLKIAVFDERWSIHGSTNLNYRSLEDDKDFEFVLRVSCVYNTQSRMAPTGMGESIEDEQCLASLLVAP